MQRDITTGATFGEDEALMDVEDDCWLVLGDVTKAILNRSMPPERRSGQVIYAAFPGRTKPTTKE